eukprot:932476-Pleurochrysis_carterae.AAC.2
MSTPTPTPTLTPTNSHALAHAHSPPCSPLSFLCAQRQRVGESEYRQLSPDSRASRYHALKQARPLSTRLPLRQALRGAAPSQLCWLL